MPYKFNHPIRAAERVAALDVLSGGRVELGTGRSSQFEQAGFEIDTARSRDMWQESLETTSITASARSSATAPRASPTCSHACRRTASRTSR